MAALNPDLLKVLGAVLGPVVGFIFTQGKAWLDRRATQRDGERSINEIERYLRYSDTLNKVANLSKPPANLQIAQQLIEERISGSVSDTVAMLSAQQGLSTKAVQDRKRTVTSRIFLLYRPATAGLWLLHGLFYVLIGVAVLGSIGAVSSSDSDWTDGLWGMGVFVVGAVICNLIANKIDRKRIGSSANEIPARRMAVVSLSIFSGVIAVVWTIAIILARKMSFYQALETVWIYGLFLVGILWVRDQRRYFEKAALTPAAPILLAILTVVLIVDFGITVHHAIQGLYPMYSAVIRGLAAAISLWAFVAAVSKRRHTVSVQNDVVPLSSS